MNGNHITAINNLSINHIDCNNPIKSIILSKNNTSVRNSNHHNHSYSDFDLHCELCNHINDLLTNINREIFGKGRDMSSGNSSSDDEYSTRVNGNNRRVNTNYRSKRKETLMKDVEMQFPELHTQATEAEKRKLFTLVIRYLCIANEHQPHSVRDSYDKQSQLYLQTQRLIMAQRRSHLDTSNNSSFNLAKNAESDDRFASFPDPTQISDCYEKYARDRDHASSNDSSRHSNSFRKNGNTIKCESLDSDAHDVEGVTSSNHSPRLKSFQSSGKNSTSASNHSRNSGGRRSGIFSGFLKETASQNAGTMDNVNEVGRRARAPLIASVRKHAAITCMLDVTRIRVVFWFFLFFLFLAGPLMIVICI